MKALVLIPYMGAVILSGDYLESHGFITSSMRILGSSILLMIALFYVRLSKSDKVN